jgi:hypothetical protein
MSTHLFATVMMSSGSARKTDEFVSAADVIITELQPVAPTITAACSRDVISSFPIFAMLK